MKFITIETFDENSYVVKTKKKYETIGFITFFKPWKKWVFEPCEQTIYDTECMKDIIRFMEEELK